MTAVHEKIKLWHSIFLLFIVCHKPEVQAQTCGCDVQSCYGPDGRLYRFDDSQLIESICPMYHSKNDSFKHCVCLHADHLNDDNFCRCESLSQQCQRVSYCYKASECALCRLGECLSPMDNCDWYAKCLNWRFPECTEIDNYALEYGDVYCRKYEQNMPLFSENGQNWVRSVRTCLQEKLIFQLINYPKPSCSTVKDAAFASHPTCYTKDGASFCELECSDIFSVMRTVDGALLQEFWATLNQAWKVSGICGRSKLTGKLAWCSVKASFQWVKLLTQTILRKKRSADCDDYCLADEVADSLFDQSNLQAGHSIEWFAIPEQSETGFEINVIITHTSFVSDKDGISCESSASVAAAAYDFATTAINQRKVEVNGQVLKFSEVLSCNGSECVNATTTVVVPEDSSAGIQHALAAYCLVVYGTVVCGFLYHIMD